MALSLIHPTLATLGSSVYDAIAYTPLR